MAAATVSVVLPTFNRLKFLRPAVESVYAQTFTDWELIFADDGSDLETRQYLQSLENRPRVTVVWLPHTGRPAIVRNAAVSRAVGEYVAFLDSDDLWASRPSSIGRSKRCAPGSAVAGATRGFLPVDAARRAPAGGGSAAMVGTLRGRHFRAGGDWPRGDQDAERAGNSAADCADGRIR